MEVASELKKYLQQHRIKVQIFVCTFIAGFFVHFYMFTNKFMNYFEMNNILTNMSFVKSDTVAMGKWFIPIMTQLSSIYSMPAVNGIIGLLFLALTTVLVCDLLQIESRLTGCLVGLLFVTFPSIASFYSYGVNSDVLCGTPCLAVLGVWLVEKGRTAIEKKKKWLKTGMGIVVIGLTVGAYQPFFAISIAAIFALLIVDVVQNGTGFKTLVKRTVWYAAVLVAGFVFYYVLLQIIMALTGVTLGDYHGVNEMTSFTPKGIAKGLVYTYLYFLRHLFTPEYANYKGMLLANVLLALGLFGLCFFWTKETRQKRKEQEQESRGNVFGLLLLIMFMPLGTLSAPFLMADRVGNGVDRYMMYSIVFVYIIFLKLFSEFPWEKIRRGRKTLQWSGLLGVCVVILSGIYMCNQAYYRMEAMTEAQNSLFTRIVYRMEETEGWNRELPVYFANCNELFNENYQVEIPEFEALTKMDGTEQKPWYNRNAIAKYMRVYLHFPVEEATEEQITRLEETEQYKEMPVYPAKDSVKIIDGVMVVKFNENGED